MEPPRIRPIAEHDLDAVIQAAGGRRAHPDAFERKEFGADYLLGDAVIELKALDEDGLDKPERRQKLATLFRSYQPDRPVIVLDPRDLKTACGDTRRLCRGQSKEGSRTPRTN